MILNLTHRKPRYAELRTKLRGSRGVGKLTLLIFGTLTAAVLYSAYHILPFYYYYYELQSHMEQMIKVGYMNTDLEIRQKLGAQIKFNSIPAEVKNIKIERGDHFMKISLPYEEIFYITWMGQDYDIHTFEFFAYAEGKF